MKKIVELPLIEPMYGTYHDGIITAATALNPSIRNWFLNQTIMLTCNRRFLNGYTTPEIRVEKYSFSNPCFEVQWIPMRFLGGYVHPVIRKLIDEGYYVYFSEIDDYYIPGKSWYQERHFRHDGAICGYNTFDKTYCIYAYDQQWVYQKFWTTQKAFERGRKAIFKQGIYGNLCAMKPKSDVVVFSATDALQGIREYLDSDIEKYPENGPGMVRGIIVHQYIARYVEKLMDGSIPYTRMDRRVFRLIWEHKRVMLERIIKLEEELSLGSAISQPYKLLVEEANTMRMLYAAHHRKRKDAVLPLIREKLIHLMEEERGLLTRLVERGERAAVLL